MLNSEAIIYLAEHRKCFQTETFRSFEIIHNVDSKPIINSIIKFSDNTLSAQNSQQILADNFVLIALIPLVGALEILSKNENKIIDSGEIVCILMEPNEILSVRNPYKNELINYLEIWINQDILVVNKIIVEKFDLEKSRNQLVTISPKNFPKKLLIGKFDGRREGSLPVENQAFVFVINGVFECQNRLIETRSSLLLSNMNELEFEGLAQENIILIISS